MVTPVSPSRPRIVPAVYPLLAAWCYAEHSLLRMIAGWGRSAGDWEDKLAVCYHVWLQAQIVDRMRRRLEQYPGGKADAPVAKIYEDVANAVLLAPSFTDAMAGVHGLMNETLVRAYTAYMASTHPVHDRPTLELLTETIALKRKQAEWYAGYRTRYFKPIDPAYESRVKAALASVGDFATVIEHTAPFAAPCGKNTPFRLTLTPGRVKDWNLAPNVMPFLEADWGRIVEARRLFFMIGYMWEMGVAENQLRWIYNADFMPWEFVYTESRHMWDESRHGNSGMARLRDFDLGVAHVGYSSYGTVGEGTLEPMTPRDVYENFYSVTQIAETGYFETKRYCFEDFLAGNDDGSAEMMQFDIIDETTHVEYGRVWLDEMMQRAGVSEDYRKRGAADRKAAQAASDQRVLRTRTMLDTGVAAVDQTSQPTAYNPVSVVDVSQLGKAREHYQWLLRVVRERCPLKNVSDAPARPNLPM